MNFSPGDILELVEPTEGVCVIEKNDIITTKKIFVEKGYYIVLDIVGDSVNHYIEILYDSAIILIFYSYKVSRII